jgi:hypothetical protein
MFSFACIERSNPSREVSHLVTTFFFRIFLPQVAALEIHTSQTSTSRASRGVGNSNTTYLTDTRIRLKRLLPSLHNQGKFELPKPSNRPHDPSIH